jgi:DNA-binding GntR family transcriptional regulator
MANAITRIVSFPEAFPQPKRVLLAESIADSVAEAIATRLLRPGDRVVETALAEKLGVSRVPIREALKVLHAQGILSGGGHRGYRVADFEPATVDKVFEVRVMLETILLRDALERWRVGTGDPADLERSLQMLAQAARSNDAASSLRADLEFHRTICAASGNAIASTLWTAIARHVLIIFSLERYRDNDLAAVARQHEAFRDQIMQWMRDGVTEAGLHAGLREHMLLGASRRGRGGC